MVIDACRLRFLYSGVNWNQALQHKYRNSICYLDYDQIMQFKHTVEFFIFFGCHYPSRCTVTAVILVPTFNWGCLKVQPTLTTPQNVSTVPETYLLACNTSTSTSNSCDWIWHVLDRFLDVGHINVQTLLQKRTKTWSVGPDLVDAFPATIPRRIPSRLGFQPLRILPYTCRFSYSLHTMVFGTSKCSHSCNQPIINICFGAIFHTWKETLTVLYYPITYTPPRFIAPSSLCSAICMNLKVLPFLNKNGD